MRAVRESVFYETSADPLRFSLLGLDLITRQQAPSPSSDAPAAVPQEDAGGEEGESNDGGGGSGWGVSGQDRWSFTFLLCKLLSG